MPRIPNTYLSDGVKALGKRLQMLPAPSIWILTAKPRSVVLDDVATIDFYGCKVLEEKYRLFIDNFWAASGSSGIRSSRKISSMFCEKYCRQQDLT